MADKAETTRIPKCIHGWPVGECPYRERGSWQRCPGVPKVATPPAATDGGEDRG